ncbi:MAG: zinc ribbon domain-containing protein [Myxococcales bacterium]|nr:zinc ribbon domain-containing protein [Myxococcales bacterium]
MPTYEYRCDNCDHEFEREQRITEKPLKKCPICGKDEARRMITGGSFILKGGGWESDLYSGPSNRSKSAAKSESGDSGSTPSTSSSGSSSKSDSSSSTSSKPDSKSKSDA